MDREPFFYVPKELRETVIPKELPRIGFLLMRHGEPRIYGQNDSALSEYGRQQMLLMAREIAGFADGLKEKIIMPVIYSDRTRTRASAEVLYGELSRVIRPERISMPSPKKSNFLQVADILNKLEEAGVPPSGVYDYWLNNLPSELARYGIQTPDQLRETILNALRKINENVARLKNSRKRFYICLTHENFMGALVTRFFRDSDPHVDYGEAMWVGGNGDGKFYFMFRGEFKSWTVF